MRSCPSDCFAAALNIIYGLEHCLVHHFPIFSTHLPIINLILYHTIHNVCTVATTVRRPSQ